MERFFYAQSQPFTCGAACLIMARVAIGLMDRPRDSLLELRLWRRTNTVYMGRGQAGSGPWGLARMGLTHGARASVLADGPLEALFHRWTRHTGRRAALEAIMRHDAREALEEGCAQAPYPAHGPALGRAIRGGALLSLAGGHRANMGHWVCVLPGQGGGLMVRDPAGDPRPTARSPQEHHRRAHYMSRRVGVLLRAA
jgi:hypothetical protein